MRVAEDAVVEELGVALDLGVAIEPAAGVVEIDVPQAVEAGEGGLPQPVEDPGRGVVGVGGEEAGIGGLRALRHSFSLSGWRSGDRGEGFHNRMRPERAAPG